MEKGKTDRSQRLTSSDESSCNCSINHSDYDSMSEGSFYLPSWKGKLSMSWESIGPEAKSSSMFLSPQGIV